MRMSWVLFVGALAACPLARAADAPLDAHDAAAVTACIVDLAGTDYKTREAAQQRLETVRYAQIETLRKYASGVTDPEARARFVAAVDEVEEIGITTAPPISMEVKNAAFVDVAAALSKALGRPLGAIDRGPEALRYTVHAKDQPFWEVMEQLRAHGDLWLDDEGTAIGHTPIQQVQIVRGAAVAVETTAPQDASELIHLKAAFDPRIKVLHIQPLIVDQVRDDQGNALDANGPAVDPVANPALALHVAQLQARINAAKAAVKARNFREDDDDLVGKHAVGRSISFRVTMKCLVEVSEASADVPNAGKHLGEAIPLGDSKVTLRGVSPAKEAGTKAGLQLEIVPNDSKLPAPPAPTVKFTTGGISLAGNLNATAGTQLIIDSEGSSGGITLGASGPTADATHILVTDATGKTVADYSVPRGVPVTSIHAVAGDFKEPLKFSFTYPTKTRELSIPFEFKDVPVK